ncbi:MAG: HAD hydrolase-like protein [Clostridia bacterium]|nr:HAD hydrolase-like protein [Clostridia bacterium]
MNGWMQAGMTIPVQGCMPGAGAGERPVLIVLDLDGTLTDSAQLGRLLFKRVFSLLGFGEISDSLADSFNGPSADEVCARMGVTGDQRILYDTLLDEVEVDLVRTIGVVYPGVHEMLEQLSSQAVLAILTNGSQAYCKACLSHYGFAPYIALHTGFVSGVSKAERIAMWEREVHARRVICVGDRRTDIDNARLAGAYAIGVTYGMGSAEELQDADCLCASAKDVAQACMRVIAAS